MTHNAKVGVNLKGRRVEKMNEIAIDAATTAGWEKIRRESYNDQPANIT
ncbi:hypothetical protein ACFLWU_00215 [Chloroflexota bacterium]